MEISEGVEKFIIKYGGQQFLIINTLAAEFTSKHIISFDDGYKSVYTHAFPIMKKMGFTGIAGIYPQFIGAGKAMTWTQLKDLIKNGWSIECHSYTHSNLAKLYKRPLPQKSFLNKEIVTSRKMLIDKLGIKANFMIWPYGVYTDTTLKLAKETGYKGAMTVDGGSNVYGVSPFFIKRQVIYSTDSMKKFLMRFEMQGFNIIDQYPQPGQVIKSLTKFRCKLPDLASYSPDAFKLSVKVSRSSCKFKFDPSTKMIHGQIAGIKKSGSYFIDVYLRNKKSGITKQNGWLFTIKR